MYIATVCMLLLLLRPAECCVYYKHFQQIIYVACVHSKRNVRSGQTNHVIRMLCPMHSFSTPVHSVAACRELHVMCLLE